MALAVGGTLNTNKQKILSSADFFLIIFSKNSLRNIPIECQSLDPD